METIKVFLVEDEFVIREGIKNNIDWKGNGIEFSGEASDGELALPMIREKLPDIVITDIKMPFMDGLEMSAIIRKEFPWMEIVLLTGYEEFEYARKGIEIGAAKYLTKPISSGELMAVIKKLGNRIISNREEREVRSKYLKEMEEQFQQERKDLLRSLVTGNKSISEIFDQAENLNIKFAAGWFNVILVKVQSARHESTEFSKLMISTDSSIGELESDDCIVFDRGLEGKAFLIKASTEKELDVKCEALVKDLESIFQSSEDIRYFGGIGKPVNRISYIGISFEEASRALAHRFLNDSNRFVDCRDLGKRNAGNDDTAAIMNIRHDQYDREHLLEYLQTGSREEMRLFIDEFFRQIQDEPMKSRMFRQYLTMDVCFLVTSFLEKAGIESDSIKGLDSAAEAADDPESTIAYVSETISEGLALRDKMVNNQYHKVIESALKFIDRNYADEELSLNTLAAHVNFSPNHLSTVFSQETGQTFIKYLTDLRMRKAKELLRSSNKKSSVISQEVGYKDPHYFSYLFKKTQGMTPTQYRAGGPEE